MKSIFKKVIIVSIIVSLSVISESVYAMVESRPGETPLNNIDVNTMFIRGRRVEQDGEALGLTAIVDQYGNESVSNNIDAHMMKNTEWGAVAYLAQSVYGKGTANSITSSGSKTGGTGNGGNYILNVAHSTTQNAYGVYGMISSYMTYVAAVSNWSNTNISTLFSSRLRYKDLYAANYSNNSVADLSDIPGGATTETFNWYGQQYLGSSSYYRLSSSVPMLSRGYNNGLFDFSSIYSGSVSSSITMRLAVVCGAGL